MDVKFDYQKKHCQYTENKKDPMVSLDGKVFDPLSIVCAFRLYPVKKVIVAVPHVMLALPVYIGMGKKKKSSARNFYGQFNSPEMKNLSGVLKILKEC